MLGSMFAIKGHRGLRRLVISNSPCSMKLWVEACNEWRRELPRSVDEVLERCERSKDYGSEEYQKVSLRSVGLVVRRAIARWPPCLVLLLYWTR